MSSMESHFPNIAPYADLRSPRFQAALSRANPNRTGQESNKKPFPCKRHSGTPRAEETEPRKEPPPWPESEFPGTGYSS